MYILKMLLMCLTLESREWVLLCRIFFFYSSGYKEKGLWCSSRVRERKWNLEAGKQAAFVKGMPDSCELLIPKWLDWLLNFFFFLLINSFYFYLQYKIPLRTSVRKISLLIGCCSFSLFSASKLFQYMASFSCWQ